jgi:uncharacterized protein (DUF2235 family)
MAENVRNLYRSIVYNYADDDELFFFGFSRGAFTVRTLAGFMNRVGLIDKDADYFLPEIYACYEKNLGKESDAWKKAFRRAENVRKCPAIKFIGVWDTVGALGAPGVVGKVASWLRGNKYAYHDVGLNEPIKNAYHALAIAERRRPFKPTLWQPWGEKRYAPKNVAAFLAGGGADRPLAQTDRVARGTPCAPEPAVRSGTDRHERSPDDLARA